VTSHALHIDRFTPDDVVDEVDHVASNGSSHRTVGESATVGSSQVSRRTE
jgi:hypothetical protein